MRNKILIILYIIFSTYLVSAQQECYEDFPSPIPTTYQNPWDWQLSNYSGGTPPIDRTTIWDVNPVATYFPIQPFVNTPFHSAASNPNVFGLGASIIKDYKKEDGWEVLVRRFGQSGIAEPNPIVVMYNKFQSKLRVFVLITQTYSNSQGIPADAAGGFIKLFFATGNEKKATANLSIDNDKVGALDNWDKSVTHIFPNVFATALPFWLYADFTMQYDPCICYTTDPNYFPTMRIEVTINNTSEVSLDLRGTIEEIIDANNGVKNTEHVSDLLSFGSTLITSATKVYKTGSDFFGALNGANNSTVTSENKQEIAQSITTLTSLGTAKYLKLIPKAGPFLAAGFKLVNFLIAGGKKTNKQESVSAGLNDLAISGTVSGNITSTTNKRFLNFYPPGIDNDPNNPQISQDLVPEHNFPMGILNLLETPIIEYTTLSDPGFPDIRMYHLKDDIKFVLNKATELNIDDVEHLQASFIYKPARFTHGWGSMHPHEETGAYFKYLYPNESLEFNAAVNGFELVSNPSDPNHRLTYRTPFVPINCFKNISFSTYVPIIAGQGFAPPEVYIQLKIILKRTDADVDANTEDVLYIVTYKVNLELISEGVGTYDREGGDQNSEWLDLPINLPNTPTVLHTPLNPGGGINWHNNNFSNYLVNPTIKSGTTINGNLKALGKITFENGVILTPGSIVEATSEIDISQINDFLPDVDFRLADISSLCSQKLLTDFEATPTEVKNFCQGTVYSDLSTFSKKGDNKEDEESFEDEQNVIVYPNPASTSFAIDFELEVEREVDISVIDISGREVLKPLHKTNLQQGSYHYLVNSSLLPAGIYFVNVTKDDVVFTEKLILVK